MRVQSETENKHVHGRVVIALCKHRRGVENFIDAVSNLHPHLN